MIGVPDTGAPGGKGTETKKCANMENSFFLSLLAFMLLVTDRTCLQKGDLCSFPECERLIGEASVASLARVLTNKHFNRIPVLTLNTGVRLRQFEVGCEWRVSGHLDWSWHRGETTDGYVGHHLTRLLERAVSETRNIVAFCSPITC